MGKPPLSSGFSGAPSVSILCVLTPEGGVAGAESVLMNTAVTVSLNDYLCIWREKETENLRENN